MSFVLGVAETNDNAIVSLFSEHSDRNGSDNFSPNYQGCNDRTELTLG